MVYPLEYMKAHTFTFPEIGHFIEEQKGKEMAEEMINVFFSNNFEKSKI